MKPEKSAREVYADIIDHTHHVSATRAPMPPLKRAAQFSPYDALTGYFDMIAEEERVTEEAIELDADAVEALNRELARLAERIERGERPRVRFTVFRPDERKAGGSFVELTERVRRIDATQQRVVLESREGRGGVNRTLALSSIIAVCPEDGENER